MNRIKQIAMSIGLVLAFAACETKDKAQQGVTISGIVDNPKESGVITLAMLEGGARKVLDTLYLDTKNTFETTVQTESVEFYQLNFYNTQIVTFIVNESDLEIHVDGSDRNGISEVTGSKEAEYMTIIQQLVKGQNDEVKRINEEYLAARNANDEEAMKNIQDDFLLMQEKKKEEIKKKVEEMLPSLATIQAMNFFNPNEDFVFMQSVAKKVYEANPNSTMAVHYNQQMEDLAKVSVGAVPPNFSMPTPAGDTVNLTDYRGQYVLVDFWAAWCKPCRAENPNLVAVYNKYKDAGLNILGVSLDRKREDWLKAIEADNLEWTQVSELKYWQTAVVQEYKISGIPFSLLLDPEGKIIAKNLRGERLQEKMAEIFGEKATTGQGM